MVPLIDEWHITDIALALFIFKFFETNVRQASVDRDSRFVQTNARFTTLATLFLTGFRVAFLIVRLLRKHSRPIGFSVGLD